MRFQLIRTYRGHQAAITALAAVPGYSRVVSTSHDGLIKIWDLRSDSSGVVRGGGKGLPTCLKVFPTGFFMASGSSDGHVKIWNLETSEIVRDLSAHDGAVTALTMTHDGQRLLSGSTDHTLQIWDTLKGVRLHLCEGYTTSVEVITVTTDNNVVLAGGHSAAEPHDTMKAWHVESGRPVTAFQHVPPAGQEAVFLRENNHLLFASAEGDIEIRNLMTGDRTPRIQGIAEPLVMALMPAQKSLIIGTQKPSLGLWHLETGEKIYQFDEPSDQVTRVTITTDGRYVIAGCQDGSLNFYMRVS